MEAISRSANIHDEQQLRRTTRRCTNAMDATSPRRFPPHEPGIQVSATRSSRSRALARRSTKISTKKTTIPTVCPAKRKPKAPIR